jgi:hypothetical protein
MKTTLIIPFAVAFAAATSYAAPADDVSTAAKKLAAAPNFSWTQTSEIANSQFTPGPVNGQTEKGGYTVITREFNGNTMQTVRKGDDVVMQNMEGEWMNREEMMQQFANRGGGGGGAPGGGGGAARGPGGGGRGGRGGGMFGAMTPADDLNNLVSGAKNLKADGDAIVGDLNEEAVNARLSFGGFGRGGGGGQTPPAPKNASGTVKFWLKDGGIAKYQVHVKGTVNGRNGEQERDVTTTTEIKDVGSTKVSVPEPAKKKLGA